MEETTKTAALLCGFGKREITPPIGTPIVGYYRQRFMKGVIDPLYVRAAFFQSGDERAIVLTMDLCLLGKDWVLRIREKCAQAFGVDVDAILVNGSHTHTGPLTGKDFASELEVDPAYIDFLVEQAFCAAGEASVDLKPARLFCAVTEAKGISFVRRYRMKDGTYATNPGWKEHELIDCAVGTPNEELRILKVQREGADDVYMVNFGTHPDTVGGEYISADWPGFVCSILEAAIHGSKGMFLLGPQGDVNHFNPFKENRGKVISEKAGEDYREAIAHARYMGRVIVGELLKVCDHMEEIGNEGISFASAEMQLPTNRSTEGLEEAIRINEIYYQHKDNWREYGFSQAELAGARRIIRMQSAPPYYSYNAFALKIGDYVIAAGPGEAFTELGRRIYAASPFAHTMVLCMTNASCGYVPAGSAYEEGGYEASTGSFSKGADDAYVDAVVKALNALEG